MASGLQLSPEEVRSLLEDKSPTVLVVITGKLAHAYSRQLLDSKDMQAAEQIFRLLLRETETEVRLAMADHIKHSTTIPRDIIMTLAKDVAEVSLPILESSEVLSDDDLLELIRATKDVKRYLAISRRSKVSGQVSGALLGQKNAEVTASLLDNEGALITESRLAVIIAESPGNSTLMEAMSRRQKLPLTIAEKLIHVVSAGIGETLRGKYQIPAKEIDTQVEKVRENETLKLVRLTATQEAIDQLVSQLIAFGRLSPSLILSSLCQGNFQFFETSLARLAGVPVANARTLIKDRGELGFRAIYNKSGLSESLFPAVQLLLKVVHELDEQGIRPSGNANYGSRVVETILQQAENATVENLSYIVALVRQTAQ
jgi:uncharacterized protein (DUF2336 family)